MASAVHETDQSEANKKGESEQNDVYGYRIVLENLVCCGIQRGLREVEKTC